jgi:hypothetical protein
MKDLYRVNIDVADAHHQMMSLTDLQNHIKQKLAYEFLPIIEQKMKIMSSPNYNDATVRYQAGLVVLSVDEYNALRYNNVSSEDKFKPLEPKQEFDAVNYLKNLMKKSR